MSGRQGDEERKRIEARRLSRRSLLGSAAGLTATAWLASACSDSKGRPMDGGNDSRLSADGPGEDGLAADALTGDVFAPADLPGGDAAVASCTVYPQQTEGPFYLSGDRLRSDVTEGRPGIPLLLTMQIVGADGCTPLPGLAVDIWHCDAEGVYSGYPGQLGGLDTTGQTFMRGTQVSGSDGKVVFHTIYPGWYPGRTTHIHFKVHHTATSEATSQLYFPEDVSAAVYAQQPYAARGQKDTANTADAVAANNLPPLLRLAQASSGWVASLRITVAAS
jgi:protocatechuate 3,4-dioxygenase beta subunit